LAILTVLGSGVAAALVNFSLAWFRARHERKVSVRYLALKISCALEEYAYECADAVTDHDTAMSSGGAIGSTVGKVLDLAELPQHSHIEHLDVKLLHEALEFPIRIKIANGEANFTFDVSDFEDASNLAARRTGEIGADALRLADRFRKKYRLPIRRLMFNDYDVRRILDVPLKS